MALLSWLHGLRTHDPVHVDCLLRSVSGLDGAYAEMYSDIVANLYQDDPRAFISAVARRPPAQARLAFGYLAYGLSYATPDVREALASQAESLLQGNELSDAERRALREIIAAVEEQQGRLKGPGRLRRVRLHLPGRRTRGRQLVRQPNWREESMPFGRRWQWTPDFATFRLEGADMVKGASRKGWALGLTLAVVVLPLAAPAVLVAGCGGASAVTPRLDGAIVKAMDGVAAPHREMLVPNGGEVMVGTGPFEFCASITPLPDEQWFGTNVAVEGQPPQTVTHGRGRISLTLSFGEGQPDETIVVKLTSLTVREGPGDAFSATLKRVTPPEVGLTVMTDGIWQPLSEGDAIETRPVKLRLSFSRTMDGDSVEQGLSRLAAVVTWIDDKTVVISVNDPPPTSLEIRCKEAHDAYGLMMGNPVDLAFYTGQAPQICAYFSSQRRERAFYVTVPDILRGQVSPNGKRLLVEAYRNRTPTVVSWATDMTTGARRRLDWSEGQWQGNQVLVRLDGSACETRTPAGDVASSVSLENLETPAHWGNSSVSPDGTKLAVFVPVGDAERHTDLTLFELGGGRLYRSIDSFLRSSREGTPDTPRAPAWSPDGKKIAGLGSAGEAGPGAAIVVTDLATGKTGTATVVSGVSAGDSLIWSGNGRLWLAGTVLVETEPPYSSQKLTLPLPALPFSYAGLSPDGGWIVRGQGTDWGQLVLYEVATGETVDLGPAMPCGWDETGVFYFVRWADSAARYSPLLGWSDGD